MNVLQYIQGIRDFSLDRPSAVTLGKFDGVHMGHQKLIEMIQEKAKQENLLSVVFTFDKIPLRLCPQKNQHFITTNTERRMFLEKQGVDVEIEYPFTEDFMNMEPEAFIEEILIGRLHAKYVVVGELVDTGSEDGDLDLGGAGVRGMGAVGLNHGRLFVLADHGRFHLSNDLPKGLRNRWVKPRALVRAVP